MNLDNRLAGKVVLVTGGGSGLGKGACERIVAEGGAVAVADIRKPLAEETAAALRKDGGQAIARPYLARRSAETDIQIAPMPKYHEHNVWDENRNAPSSNFSGHPGGNRGL